MNTHTHTHTHRAQLLAKWLGRDAAWDEAGTAGMRAGSVLVGVGGQLIVRVINCVWVGGWGGLKGGGVPSRLADHASLTY